ncbi:MAG: hypothetical protein M1305_05475, partial [Candidatus Marsarchaeota archaeon]|nr:hypothetical protein [Candidatus Marsarchaeota archaeon]
MRFLPILGALLYAVQETRLRNSRTERPLDVRAILARAAIVNFAVPVVPVTGGTQVLASALREIASQMKTGAIRLIGQNRLTRTQNGRNTDPLRESIDAGAQTVAGRDLQTYSAPGCPFAGLAPCDKYCIKDGYEPRLHPQYFDDGGDNGLVYQPEVYDLAYYLAK